MLVARTWTLLDVGELEELVAEPSLQAEDVSTHAAMTQ